VNPRGGGKAHPLFPGDGGDEELTGECVDCVLVDRRIPVELRFEFAREESVIDAERNHSHPLEARPDLVSVEPIL
jgi:hypothetical protein